VTAPSYRSPAAGPTERGHDFGRTFAAEIARNVSWYRQLFHATGQLSTAEIRSLGAHALDATSDWAPGLATEIEAIATGAGLAPELVAALNARTEILGSCRARSHECTTVVALGPEGSAPIAVQTWDWHDGVADGWLIWTIEEPSGRIVQTLTEYGIVGKLGVSSSRIALLLNILRHREDARRIGTPIHVIARRVLSDARDLNDALLIIASASPSASSAMTFVAVEGEEQTALTAELWSGGPSYVLPDRDGLIVHTNHFLDQRAAAGDREPALGPDSFLRYEIVRRRLETKPTDKARVHASLVSHLGGAGAVCCHPDPSAPLGERYMTLATVSFDVAGGRLDVHSGTPCTRPTDPDEALPTHKEAAWLPSS